MNLTGYKTYPLFCTYPRFNKADTSPFLVQLFKLFCIRMF
ncbi:hypothetical protein IX330_002039 [Bacteroides pyogenes]|nr:hypothetical protein [Bacteroides pyogenes]MBR8720885.1 hypothetical protein [Bacteroides pyogenes]MBR8754880.1 hypothetical protein [Bacteroides pyogenes]MBR8793242.1 hypothetical protein [Bacteroides pyogenes]